MSDYLKALELQRRAFEAQFGTIEDLGFEDKTKEVQERSDEDSEQEEDEDEDLIDYDGEEEISESDDEDEFTGFSEGEEEVPIQQPIVVKFSETSSNTYVEPTKKELKAIRSGKILTVEQQRLKDELVLKMQLKQVKDTNDEENLKNDLELQRLLKESHFLSNTKNDFSGAELTMQTIDYEEPIGKARKRAMDSRIKLISETNSNLSHKKLENMPMSMRKGLVNSTKLKISKFERDARENGIILSKTKKGELRDLSGGKGSTSIFERIGNGVAKPKKMRDRGLKINSVGKSTRNGLILNERDLAKINGPSFDNKKKKSRRGRK